MLEHTRVSIIDCHFLYHHHHYYNLHHNSLCEFDVRQSFVVHKNSVTVSKTERPISECRVFFKICFGNSDTESLCAVHVRTECCANIDHTAHPFSIEGVRPPFILDSNYLLKVFEFDFFFVAPNCILVVTQTSKK